MAIITCPKCGTKHSDRAPQCPGCSAGEGEITITCPLCKTGVMRQGSVRLFSDSIVRFCGYMFAGPAVAGVLAAINILFSQSPATPLENRLASAGGVVAASIAAGVVGWIILSSKPAWLCPRCGHYQPKQ